MRVSALVVLIGLLAACGRPLAVGSDTETSGVTTLESTSTTSTTGTSATSTTSMSSSDSAESSDSDESYDTGSPCEVEVDLGPDYTYPHVLFVVDVSSSMRETWDDDQAPVTPMVTRWSTAHALLEQLLFSLDGYFWVALQRAPSIAACAAATVDDPMCTDADVCLVEPTPEVDFAQNHDAEILAALPDASASPLEIVGGSPIRAAYTAARDHLLALPEGTNDLIVLITDGGASCSEPSLPQAVETFDDELASTVAEGFQTYDIPTLVVGVGVAEQPTEAAQPDSPAVDTHTALNELGIAGGLPWSGGMEPRKYFDAVAPFDVVKAIRGAGCLATTCTVDLTMTPQGPPDPLAIPYVGVYADDVAVPFVRDCQLENGWAWATEGEVVSLCGSYCEAYLACTDDFTLSWGLCGE